MLSIYLFFIIVLTYILTVTLVIFGCAGSSLLCGLSLVVVSGGYSLAAVQRLLIEVTSLVTENRL